MRLWSLLGVAAVSLATLGGRADGQTADPLALDGIAHVAFRVSDVAVSRAFYQKLGFEQAFEFNDANGTTTSYMKVNDRQFVELYRRGPAAEPIGLMHICFDGSDLERLRGAYAERGLQPGTAAKARAGNLLFTMRDPEGQLLEYTQYLAGSLHWNARGKFAEDRRISEHLQSAATAVKDLTAERAFYRDKLGFEDHGGDHAARLRVPGNSGEEVHLQTATPDWKPRIEFTVADVALAAGELRHRDLPVRMSADSAVVIDPDGNEIVFTSRGAPTARAILALEREALEGWRKGDPDALLSTLDPEITYFHAVAPQRLDGISAVKALFEAYRGRPLFDSFEIVNPKVQVSGDVAVLTYLFVRRNGTITSRWNATQVYQQRNEGWRVIHTHWSVTGSPPVTALPSPPEN